MQAPAPDRNETFDHYSIRAQRALFAAVRDPFERIRLVRYTWRQHRGATAEEQLADQKFSPERYRKEEDVCVFAEHDTTDSQGKPRSYRLRDLAQIVRYCNDRAREHQAFAAIADRHTSNPGDPNPSEPRVLGYAGPYRLGLIGDRKPTWAIFCDEYRFPGAAETFLQKNRRSVELWTDKKTGRRWFDPITTCGADAPRLPLPARYTTMFRAGMDLERYTVGAPGFASPSATSTSLKTATPAPPVKQCYAAEDGAPTDTPTSGGAQMGANFEQKLGDMSVSDLTDIIMSLPPIQWAMSQMAKPETAPGMDQLSASPSAPAPQGPPPGAPQTAPGGPPGTEPDGDENLSDLDDLLGQGNDEPPGAGAGPADDTPPPEEGEDDDKEKNSMSAYTARTIDDLTKENYALKRSQDTLVREFATLRSQYRQMSNEAVDAKRQARFADFASRYPQFPLDEADRKPALYSMGGNMSDESFDAHMANLERYAQRIPVASFTLPQGEAPHIDTPDEAEKYQMRLKDRTVELYTMSLDSERPLNWEEASKAAAQELKG